jgi:hypothetical protein
VGDGSVLVGQKYAFRLDAFERDAESQLILRGMIARLVILCALVAALPLFGCQMLANRATSGMAENISAAVLDQEDVLIVRDGGPAYLIAIDGLIQGDPDNPALLLAGARLYAAYAGAFVSEPERAQRLTLRAKNYGARALCIRRHSLCDAAGLPFDTFERKLAKTKSKDVPALYGLGSAWASWIQANAGDWNAIADIPKVQAIMERVVQLRPAYESGGAHLYLGVLYTLRPESMGGKPELGRRHFESAIELSRGRNLTAKLLFARQYARLVFDRPLHDQLLNEIVNTDPDASGFTLSNVLAQEEARELLADADEYF